MLVRGGFVVVLLTFLVSFSVSAAHAATGGAWGKEEEEAFLAAVEDYRFSDFDAAIQTLSKLHQRFPERREVTRYLALSYEESGKLDEARKIYREWVASEKMSLRQEMREAWLGYARVYRLAGKPENAADILRQWLDVHPDDVEAAMMYGDILVRLERFPRAEEIWRRLLARPSLSPVQQAAAHYYLAFSAAARGDYTTAREEAERSLRASPDGMYAPLAKELAKARPGGRAKGLTGSLSVAGLYSSNVDLLPDIVQHTGGKKKSDLFTQTDFSLAYQGERWRLGYALSASRHLRRTDFDLEAHSVFLDLNIGAFVFSPRFEYVILDIEQLYRGAGFDISWMNAGWLVSYQGRYREFNSQYGAQNVDLRRLGGFSHQLNVGRQFALKNTRYLLLGYAHKEATKGDATHNKSDDYLEFGANAMFDREWKHADVGVFARGYWRRYAKADKTILVSGNAKRRDRYIQIGGHVAYRPFATAENRIVLQGHWQRNSSNYKAPLVAVQFGKNYTEWQAGVSWQRLW